LRLDRILAQPRRANHFRHSRDAPRVIFRSGTKTRSAEKLVSPVASTRSPSLRVAIEIFLFRFYRNYVLLFASRPARGAFRDRHDTRVGCGGRDMSQRVFCARTNGMVRTAKSCGPGIPVLMPSLRWCVLRTARTTGAREPVPGESAKDTVKTIARGMPDVRLNLW
jgi:hypothetical protein